MKSILEELVDETISVEMCILIYNQSAINVIKTGVFNRRSKHINIRFLFINEKVKKNIKIAYGNTQVIK